MITDGHTHILYDIDDGASDISESVRLIEMETANDVDTVILTPHFDSHIDSVDIFVQKCRERHDNLLKYVNSENITMILGSETVYSSLLMYYSRLTPLCIFGTRYLLLEFSPDMEFNKQFLADLDKLIHKFDIVPIIVHIERYAYIKKHIHTIDKLKQLGCVIQVNAGYILQDIENRFVKQLFKYDYIDMVASDCHDSEKRTPNLKKTISLIDEIYDGYYSQNLANKYKFTRENRAK